MKIAIILLINFFLLASCNNKEKFEFIKNYLEEPEQLIELLEKADFDAATELKYLKKSKDYFNRNVSWAKNFKINDCNDKKVFFEVAHYYSDRNLVKIIIAAKNGFRLKFIWDKNNDGDWKLNSITEDKEPEEYEHP